VRSSHHHSLEPAPYSAAHKNLHIQSGYAVHHTPLEAVWDALVRLRVYNETQNVMSALTGFIYGAIHLWQAYSAMCPTGSAAAGAAVAGNCIDPVYAPALYWYGGVCVVNAVCVVAYHAMCTYAPWYHALSALDLFVASVGATNVIVPNGLIPGLAASFPPGNGAPSAEQTALTWWTAAASVTLSACIAVYRVYIGRESPPWLLLLCGVFFPLTLADYYRGQGSRSLLSASSVWVLVVGFLMFATKYPERLVARLAAAEHWEHTSLPAGSHLVRAIDIIGSRCVGECAGVMLCVVCHTHAATAPLTPLCSGHVHCLRAVTCGGTWRMCSRGRCMGKTQSPPRWLHRLKRTPPPEEASGDRVRLMGRWL